MAETILEVALPVDINVEHRMPPVTVAALSEFAGRLCVSECGALTGTGCVEQIDTFAAEPTPCPKPNDCDGWCMECPD